MKKRCRCRTKKGWYDEGKAGTILAGPFEDRYGTQWIAVEWDDEEDPETYKVAALDLEGPKAKEGK